MTRSLRDWKFWALTALTAVFLVVSVANVATRGDLRLRQTEVLSRQQYLSESAALGRLNTQIIQALATLSAQGNDEAIKAMLAKHGVTFTVNANSNAPQPIASEEQKTGGRP